MVRAYWLVFTAVLLIGCNPSAGPPLTVGEQPELTWDDIGIQDYTPSPAQRRFDVRHYDLRFTIDPGTCRVTAETTIRGHKEPGLGELELDFYDHWAIDSVACNRQRVEGRRVTPQKLHVPLPDASATTFTVTVRYHGRPFRVHSDSGWPCGLLFDSAGDQPLINTCFQPFFARSLFPCKDHPSDKAEDGVDVTVTVPRPLRVVATGRRVRVSSVGTSRTEHWRSHYAVATNVISFAAGVFHELKGTYRTIEGRRLLLHYFVRPEHAAVAREAFAEVPRVLRIYENLFGPYPFVEDKFGLVETSYAQLENQTAIAYGDRYPEKKLGRGEYDYGLVHETAHEWAGNAVTCTGWQHIWLHEGLATYAEGLYLEERDGRDALRALARTWQERAGDGALTDRNVNSDEDIFYSPVTYQRAAAVLHMLRFYVGDQPFRIGLKRFLESPVRRYGHADTDGFRRVMEAEAGQSLEAFFRDWVRGVGFFSAEYEVDGNGEQVAVAIRSISGEPEPHCLPVTVRLEAGDRVEDRTVTVGPTGAVVRFPRPTGSWRVLLDPENWLLRTEFLNRPGLRRELEGR